LSGGSASLSPRAGRDYGIPVSGTMAHSFIQSYDDELTAFRAFAAAYPDNCVLLVDTYETLRSGLPNAIIVGREMKARSEKLKGVRLDSGDLAWLAQQARRMLDEAGLQDVKIAASNQLDEHVIKSLRDQGVPIYTASAQALSLGGPMPRWTGSISWPLRAGSHASSSPKRERK
jgi:nicotinate phosphoribosyltransferase